MPKWFNSEIAFGFVLGTLVLLSVFGVLSYQTQHCQEVDQHYNGQPANDKTPTITTNNETRDGPESQYNKKHPISCGIVGIFPAVVGLMDHNEGFFVGAFTAGLFFATIFLWQSTNRLWAAAKGAANAAAESNKISRELFISENRPWVSIGIAPADDFGVWVHEGVIELPIKITLKNVGRSPATRIMHDARLVGGESVIVREQDKVV